MQITSLGSKIMVTDDFSKDLESILKDYNPNAIFVLVDENTKAKCWPIVKAARGLDNAKLLQLIGGEENKSIENTVKIWDFLSKNGADRKSLFINLGGGLIGDMGGFAAASFKRGIDFINIPTTLLAQVDASIGGKLGINFNHLKNEIGFFKTPKFVLINSEFLKTLDFENLLSGFAEMIKHSLIYSLDHWNKIKLLDLHQLDLTAFTKLIAKSIFIKNDFVKTDFTENNIRKGLNFGHTFGHAFESLLIDQKRPVLHGKAVAFGMICELFLSHRKLGFDQMVMTDIVNIIKKLYGKIEFKESDFEFILDFMTHDKKNQNQMINFTLLKEIGTVEINNHCNLNELKEAFKFFVEL